MVTAQAETYGKLLLIQVYTHIWYGDWDQYEQMIEQIPQKISHSLPFHPFYDRKEVSLAYDNYFVVPGDYFIPPYISTYRGQTEEAQQEARQNLLCLVGAFEKVGFYYPLEKDKFPDHIGSITAFIAALLHEEIKAYEQGNAELVESLQNLQKEVYEDYLHLALKRLWKHHEQTLDDPFFKHFLPYYMETVEMIIHSHI